ncbi:unnamed protein product [Linum tenue]|uniref:MADS-box domain-containing protein n=1 Tax=Linum tenue TaxID=586396 RepID=A0AAV0LZY1_9ROSI|nr:unnamed protein product [Linum tenue]
MVKIESESNRLVTFSKRRSGIFKKASELATLCGIEVAIIVFSPGQRVFSFGHPSVEHIVNRFYSGRQQINLAPTPATPTTQFIESQRKTRLQELGFELTQVLDYLEMAKKRGVQLDRITRANRNKTLMDTPMEKLDTPQLLQLKASLELLKAQVENQAHIKAQAHAMAQAHYAQAQVQAEHQRQQQQLQQLYMNAATVALPPPPPAAAAQPQLQLAAVESNNNNMNNNAAAAAASASANHLEFYQRIMNGSNLNGGGGVQIGDGSVTVANGNVAVNGNGAFQEYRRI